MKVSYFTTTNHLQEHGSGRGQPAGFCRSALHRPVAATSPRSC
jgi:hypothetical protein